MNPEPLARLRADVLGASLLLIALAWTPLIDRQDIVKLFVASLGATALALVALRDRFVHRVVLGWVFVVSSTILLVVSSYRVGIESWSVVSLAAFAMWAGEGCSGRRLSGWIVIAAVAQAALAVIGFLGDPLGLSSEVAFRGRLAVGSFGNPTLLGIWLAACLPVCLARRSASSRFAAGLIIAGVLATQSRVGIAMAVAALGWVAIDRARSMSVPSAVVTRLAFAAVGLMLVWTASAAWESWSERSRVVWASLRGLLEVSRSGWLTGLGPEGFSKHWPQWRDSVGLQTLELQHAHHDALEWWIDYGVLGLALWGALVTGAWSALRAADIEERAAGGALALLLLAGLVQPTLIWAPGSWLAAVLCSMGRPWPQAKWKTGSRWLPTIAGLLIAVTAVVIAIRASSEVLRSRATRGRVLGRPSLGIALQAAAWDSSNYRAWLEVAMAAGSDDALRRAALRRAGRHDLTQDLVPIDEGDLRR